MRRVKPLLGALHIYGKDSHGRKIILPTDWKPIIERQSMIERLRRFFPKSKERHKTKRVPWKASDANEVSKEYMRRVLITLNQYKWKQGVFIKEKAEGAFN